MNDVMQWDSTKKILKSCRERDVFAATDARSLSRLLLVLLAWQHNGIPRPAINPTERRELEHHLRILAGGASGEGNTETELAQVGAFIAYLVDTFGDPVTRLAGLEIFDNAVSGNYPGQSGEVTGKI